MPRTRTALPVELERRLCLRCGYRGRLLQGERGLRTFTCPSCRCDLYARPPRSYAEMEGLVDLQDDPRVFDESTWIFDAPTDVEPETHRAPLPSPKRTFGPRLEITVAVCVAFAVALVAVGRALIG